MNVAVSLSRRFLALLALVPPAPTMIGVAPGMGTYVVGSLAQAHAAVQRGELRATEVNFFSGYAACPIERLKEEVDSTAGPS